MRALSHAFVTARCFGKHTIPTLPLPYRQGQPSQHLGIHWPQHRCVFDKAIAVLGSDCMGLVSDCTAHAPSMALTIDARVGGITYAQHAGKQVGVLLGMLTFCGVVCGCAHIELT
jgi:hypothetical protein